MTLSWGPWWLSFTQIWFQGLILGWTIWNWHYSTMLISKENDNSMSFNLIKPTGIQILNTYHLTSHLLSFWTVHTNLEVGEGGAVFTVLCKRFSMGWCCLTRGCLARHGDSFGYNDDGGGALLASEKQRPGKLLCRLSSIKKPSTPTPKRKILPSCQQHLPRLRNYDTKCHWRLPRSLSGKASICQCRSGFGRSPREGNGNPLQYSCLGNPMDRGAWRATVRGFAKSQTWLSLHTHRITGGPEP